MADKRFFVEDYGPFGVLILVESPELSKKTALELHKMIWKINSKKRTNLQTKFRFTENSYFVASGNEIIPDDESPWKCTGGWKTAKETVELTQSLLGAPVLGEDGNISGYPKFPYEDTDDLYSWEIPYFETKKEAILAIPYFFNDESERAFKTALKEYLH